VKSVVLERNVPAHLRDPGRRWYGLSMRARTIFYSRSASIQDPRYLRGARRTAWKGRLCLRTSRKVYNQSLVAMMIAEQGESATEKIVRGWVGNLATDVFANDTQLLEAIAAGQCDVASQTRTTTGASSRNGRLPVKPFWANQKAGGVHVNISGAGVTGHSRRAAAATRFLEWLSAPRRSRTSRP